MSRSPHDALIVRDYFKGGMCSRLWGQGVLKMPFTVENKLNLTAGSGSHVGFSMSSNNWSRLGKHLGGKNDFEALKSSRSHLLFCTFWICYNGWICTLHSLCFMSPGWARCARTKGELVSVFSPLKKNMVSRIQDVVRLARYKILIPVHNLLCKLSII